jgi:ABC-type phosphate/phosphonate transport system ATPase subunit
MLTSMAFQEFNLFGNATVLHNVLIGRLPFMTPGRWLTWRFTADERARMWASGTRHPPPAI